MPNRLADSTSPYLLQHKDNPVDWHEWGDEAFAEARERDLPILLSVGYSACHWCHVMAHESFEDPETADQMNRLFINVKVDREERPDVDSIYMEAVQAMSGHGGWPMTVFIAPDGRPFFAGTYFPKEDRHGMPSFRRVLEGVSHAWEHRREEVLGQADELTGAISRTIPSGEAAPSERQIQDAYEKIASSFDGVNGGFGGAPKFPQQPVLEFILRVRSQPWADRADEILTTTLTEMADGGIHDQLGGGFSRYSVDAHWLVPHFEKMLYDNAQLARLYLWAGVELGEQRFIDVARSTLDYLLTDLRDPGGGFYSAEDADSEGVEGKFYAWTVGELIEVLGPEDGARAAHFFGATEAGNFEGSNVLYRPGANEPDATIDSIRARLLEARGRRVRPGLDDKVVTSWNGLAIRAFAEAGAALGEARYIEAAGRCAEFITENLVVDGKVMRSWREGRAGVDGFLEDNASLAVGLFSLYQATGDYTWYSTAESLTRILATRFGDPDGAFFDTSHESPSLVKRPKSQTDNPLPSGNALAAEAIGFLASFTGEPGLFELRDTTLASAGLLMDRYPSMVGHHLAVSHSAANVREVAVVGPDWRTLSQPFWSRFRPESVLAVSVDSSEPIPLLSDRFLPGMTRGFVCRGFVCDLPVDSEDGLLAQLE